MTPTTKTISLTAALSFHRCITFTLPDGTTCTAKVLGDKAEAAASAKALIALLPPTPKPVTVPVTV